MRLNQILKVAVCNIAMAILCLPLIPGKALAQTFSNTSPITISDNAPANPFPSNITINGLDPTQIYTISEIT
uniref:hypothetical protein n=1 Tax=Armatimonas sp. TaxID=1872638 RepID=UPI00286C1DFC